LWRLHIHPLSLTLSFSPQYKKRSRFYVIITHPAAARVELGLALIQGLAAPGALVDPILIVLVVLSRTGGLGALLTQDVVLVLSQDGLPDL
jgi:hypothetical protein